MRHAFHALAAALLFTGAAHAAPQVQISPTTASLLPGEVVEVTITGTGFDMTTFGGGLSLQWNPDVLDLQSVVMDTTTWETARNGGLVDAASGTLSDMYFASFIGRSGSLPIAMLRFVADKPGSTQLAMAGLTDFPFADELVEVIPVGFSGANITVTAVPEPSAALLLLGGLATLAWRRRTV
jgi:PEP-CTERM motif